MSPSKRRSTRPPTRKRKLPVDPHLSEIARKRTTAYWQTVPAEKRKAHARYMASFRVVDPLKQARHMVKMRRARERNRVQRLIEAGLI